MIIWITGVAAVGKSTVTEIIKSKLKNYYLDLYEGDDHEYTSKSGFKIPFSTYGGKVMVIGRSGLLQVLKGSDGVTVGINRFENFLHYEYFKWQPTFTPQIIVEGNKFISRPEMHHFLINENIKYKMYYLHAPRDVIDRRSEKRGNGYDRNIRTSTLIDKQLKNYEFLISKYKNVIVRKSETEEEQKNIADEIFKNLKL